MSEAFDLVGWENISKDPNYFEFSKQPPDSKMGYRMIYRIRFFHPDTDIDPMNREPKYGDSDSQNSYKGRVQEFRRISGIKGKEVEVWRVGINVGLIPSNQFKELALGWTEDPDLHKDAVQANSTGNQLTIDDITKFESELKRQLRASPQCPVREIAFEDMERYFPQACSESSWR
jgi:hypothetical protein